MARHDPLLSERVLLAIEELSARYGFPPTIRELAAHLGVASPSTVLIHLRRLSDAGRISYWPQAARSVRVLGTADVRRDLPPKRPERVRRPAARVVAFWAKVERHGPDECWPWTASRMPTGYGRLSFDSRTDNAHRVAWRLSNGPIPDGMQVLHECDNPPCCNPAHLFLGTIADNMHDRDAKGRGRFGPNAPHKQTDVA